MSQNFSKMSDIYIPELIELDSYWQKAVEDAIYDTLKGEKRLYHALKNRKKINRKLERLGLKPLCSQMSFSGRCNFNSGNLRAQNRNFSKRTSYNTDWESLNDMSATSLPSVLDSQEGSDRESGSRSKSNGRKETPPEKEYRNPERPLLGDGSLEKMKKSQNSFNCEPMGRDNGAVSVKETTSSEFDKDNLLSFEKVCDHAMMLSDLRPDDAKKVEWLHVRDDKLFEDSETETSNRGTSKEIIDQTDFQKHPSFKDPNYGFSKDTQHSLQFASAAKMPRANIPMVLDPKEDLFWENEVKNAIRENTGLERKLYLALAKREIVNENLQGSKMADGSNYIQICDADPKWAAKRRKSTKLLSPFIRFYLEVYRELCHRCPMKRIATEAAARWWEMKRSNLNTKKSKK